MNAGVMDQRLQSLAKVSEIWLDSTHPLREMTVQALQVSTGFTRRQIEMTLTNCFIELSADKIHAYIASFAPGKRKSLDVFHVLPSNAFTAWVHGATLTLIFGHRCLLKPSAREPVFAAAWKKSLAEIDPSLAEQVDMVTWDAARIKNDSVVIAYGSDETVRRIRSQLPTGTRFAAYGHKLSLGIIFAEAFRDSGPDELIDRIRQDAEPFRLQGCLSPQILYVQDKRYGRWPELESQIDSVPRLRVFESWEGVGPDLAKFTPYLSCVGYAGSPDKAEFLSRELAGLQVSRICPLGEMQRPPLSWANGGVQLINLLN